MPRHVCSKCGRKLSSAMAECSHCALTFSVKRENGRSLQRVLGTIEPILLWSGGGLFLLSCFIIDHTVKIGLPMMAAGFFIWLAGKLISAEQRIVSWIRSRRLR